MWVVDQVVFGSTVADPPSPPLPAPPLQLNELLLRELAEDGYSGVEAGRSLYFVTRKLPGNVQYPVVTLDAKVG